MVYFAHNFLDFITRNHLMLLCPFQQICFSAYKQHWRHSNEQSRTEKNNYSGLIELAF